MGRNIDIRGVIRGVAIAGVIACAALISGCGGEGATTPPPATVRKSASAMTEVEIDRFRRAFEYAVGHGRFDAFNDQHYDHHHHRHHGADVLATSPMTVAVMPTTWGYRLLPWHRSFLLEAEAMLRAALRERDHHEGRDPAEADLLFIPYWDAANEQSLPAWVTAFQPRGGTALVPPGLPPGHAGYGKQVGERYDIVFGRWPGQNLVFDTLHGPDYAARILARPTFVEFYDALDTSPEIMFANYPKALAALDALEKMLPGDPAPPKLRAALTQMTGGGDTTETTNALFALGHRAAVEARKTTPDAALIAAVKDLFSLFNFMPHLRMHLWAGGLDPKDANVRGTVTYFNELTVDPVFWMLHAEIDRYWYTWELSHDGKPPLTGDDTQFHSLTPEQGKWYGGGKTYALDALTDHESLGYTYDALYR